jgi:hypothetical protein
MTKKIYRVFKEATSFAKQLANEIGCVTSVKPSGDGWEVFTEQPSPDRELTIRHKLCLLPDYALMEKLKAIGTLDQWLLDVISEILRARNQTKPADAYSVRRSVCPSCGQVAGNCTCGRSWF